MWLPVRPWAVIIIYFLSCGVSVLWCFKKSLVEAEAHGFDLTQPWHFGRHTGSFATSIALLVEYLLHSELRVFLLLNFLLSLYAFSALVTTAVFLGSLSSRESTLLTERLIKYVVFKLIFVGAVLKPDILEVTIWLAWFAVVGYMKMFVGAAKDRLEAIMASPVATASMHVRTLGLLVLILVHNCAGVFFLWWSLPYLSWTKLLLYSFDTAIIFVDGSKTLLRYGVHMLDHSLASTWQPQSLGVWESWEGKGAFLYHTELIADVIIHLMTLAHYAHVWFLHGLAFHLVDALLFLDIRAVAVSMHHCLRAYLHYRAATHNLNFTFPNASPEELQRCDFDCAICRDRMQVAKQLPCSHVFHLSCLRAWLEQSGSDNFTCPICRSPLFLSAAQGAQRLQDGGWAAGLNAGPSVWPWLQRLAPGLGLGPSSGGSGFGPADSRHGGGGDSGGEDSDEGGDPLQSLSGEEDVLATQSSLSSVVSFRSGVRSRLRSSASSRSTASVRRRLAALPPAGGLENGEGEDGAEGAVALAGGARQYSLSQAVSAVASLSGSAGFALGSGGPSSLRSAGGGWPTGSRRAESHSSVSRLRSSQRSTTYASGLSEEEEGDSGTSPRPWPAPRTSQDASPTSSPLRPAHAELRPSVTAAESCRLMERRYMTRSTMRAMHPA